MIRKLNVLILKSFIGPFVLTTFVATFVLLIQYMLKYFDDFVGKNLGFAVFAELIFYFSLNMLQVALPLGVLVSSLMSFGNLGEHFELTAIKSAGISLIQTLKPIFIFVVLLTGLAVQFNNYVVPAANLKAYSLLYDIKHKKPALDIKEGVFYNGIPDYSIKVREKFPDNTTMLDILIYDHTDGKNNRSVILADSGRMFTMYNDRYLKLELFNGNYYNEEEEAKKKVDQFHRSNFKQMDLVFNLSSFDLKRTKEELFQNNRQMKNIRDLSEDIDSLKLSAYKSKRGFFLHTKGFFSYHIQNMEFGLQAPALEAPKSRMEVEDSIPDDQKQQLKSSMAFWNELAQVKSQTKNSSTKPDSFAIKREEFMKNRRTLRPNSKGVVLRDEMILVDSTLKKPQPTLLLDTLSWAFLNKKVAIHKSDVVQSAKTQAQNVKVNLTSVYSRVDNLEHEINAYTVEKYKKFSQAFACIVMFLIGAPLGSIIKKGGLGVPVIVSIVFFIVYYVINILSEKWAKEGIMDPTLAPWIADLCLLPVGLFFLRQARLDARLFDTDFYNVWIDKLTSRFKKS